jgi:hypothetical protein
MPVIAYAYSRVDLNNATPDASGRFGLVDGA